MAGCTPDADPSGSGPSGGTAGTGTDASPPPTDGGPVVTGLPGPGGPPAGPEAGAPVWLPPIGPVGRGDPEWYYQLLRFNCEAASGFAENTSEAGGQVLLAAAEICRALRAGGSADEAVWEGAASRLAAATGVSGNGLECHEEAVASVLGGLIAAHRSNPGEPVRPALGTGMACTPTITGVANTERDGDASPPPLVCAGDLLEIEGENLEAGVITTVRVGSAEAGVDNGGFRDSFAAPDPGAAGATAEQPTVEVSVSGGKWETGGKASIAYDFTGACGPAGGGSPESPAPDTPATRASDPGSPPTDGSEQGGTAPEAPAPDTSVQTTPAPYTGNAEPSVPAQGPGDQ